MKKNGYLKTYAFLNEGSSVTLIEKEVFDLLGINGVSEPLCLRWTGDTTRRVDKSVKVSISMVNPHSATMFTIKDVHTVKSLNLPSQSLDMKEIKAKYPYMDGIPIQSYTNAKPSIIIGVDNWKVAVPLKIREGLWG